MKNPKVFIVTAIEYFEAVDDKDPKNPVVHIWEGDRIGTDAESLIFQIKTELAEGKKGEEIAAFYNRLKVRVDLVNFQD